MTDAIDARVKIRDLKSAQAGKGASMVGVQDSAGAYTGTDVETALSEVADGTTLDGRYLLASNNLSDLTNAATARTNLGLAIGTDVQAYDADLGTWVANDVTVLAKTGDYAMSSGDHFVVSTPSGASSNITLPDPSVNLYPITIKHAGSATTTVVLQYAAEGIDGSNSKSMTTQYDSVTLQSDGTDWHIIAYYSGGGL